MSALDLSKALLLIYFYSVPKFKILEDLLIFSLITSEADLSTRQPELNTIPAYIISFRTNFFQPTPKLSPSLIFKEALSMKLHRMEISELCSREAPGRLKGNLPGNASKCKGAAANSLPVSGGGGLSRGDRRMEELTAGAGRSSLTPGDRQPLMEQMREIMAILESSQRM